MEQKKLNRLIKTITVLATAFLVILVGVITYQRIVYSNYDKQVVELQKEITALQEKRSNLEDGIEKRSSSIYLEELARSELLIKDGETYFEVTEK
ncbi:MAG: septum formation initiator family protein [Clostridia bacterium]|nr:septum formation initiator family protein [Clostridia bacterium]